MDNIPEKTSSVSIILEQEITPDKTEAFLQWQAEIIEASRQFKGYLRTENFPPSPDTRDKWYTVIHFDTPENLTHWLESDIRHYLIKTKQKNLGFHKWIGYKTGFEAWLSPQKNIPKWKQALVVLFGLYPTVMTENLLFSHWPILQSLPFATQMFINNLISCAALTWMVMPLVTKLFSFWLTPQSPTNPWIGGLLILLGLGIMVYFFTVLI